MPIAPDNRAILDCCVCVCVCVFLFIFFIFFCYIVRMSLCFYSTVLWFCSRVQKCFPTRKAAADVLATQSRYLLRQRAKHVYTETARVLQFKAVCDAGHGDTVAELVRKCESRTFTSPPFVFGFCFFDLIFCVFLASRRHWSFKGQPPSLCHCAGTSYERQPR